MLPNLQKLDSKPRNDLLQDDESYKRTKDTIRSTKRKLDQLDNQTPCWPKSKEKPPTTDQQRWGHQKKKKKNPAQTTTNPKHLYYHYQTQQSLLKILDGNESSSLTPKERSLWKKESNKHKSQSSLIKTKNKFKLMEKKRQESL